MMYRTAPHLYSFFHQSMHSKIICSRYVRFASSTALLTQLNRLSHVSSALKTSPSSLLKKISINHKKRIYCNYNGTWFRFHSAKEVIVPFHIASNLALSAKREVSLFDINEIPLAQVSATPKVPVIALLGHYDHGKTTILDALSGSVIADSEAHGITQVNRFHRLPTCI